MSEKSVQREQLAVVMGTFTAVAFSVVAGFIVTLIHDWEVYGRENYVPLPFFLVANCLGSGLGGVVTALIAERYKIMAAHVTGLMVAVTAWFFGFLGSPGNALASDLRLGLGAVCMAGCATFGGFLVYRYRGQSGAKIQ